MTTNHVHPRLAARVVSGALLSLTMLGAPAVTGTTSAQAAEPTRSDFPSCQQVWGALPTALREDIAAAVGLDQPQQRRALRVIRRAALRGSYGDEVQARARQARERRITLRQSLPAALKADVRAARSLPGRERRRAMTAIRYAALHGTYGDRVQRLVEQRRAWLEGCPSPARFLESDTGLDIG